VSDNQPNIIFLTIDALRYDRTNIGGYARPTTPTLARLAQNAINCTHAFSLGPFTQSAFVQIMTSSRPLSFGGFDHGAWNRPDTLFKRFRDSGYYTTAISTLHWVNKYYGYGDGLDEEWQLFTLNTVAGVCVSNMKSTVALYLNETITVNEALIIVKPLLEQFFENALDYCETRHKNSARDKVLFRDSLFVNSGYNFSKVKRAVKSHQQAFKNAPAAYFQNHFQTIPQAHEWIALDWQYARTLEKLITEGFLRLSHKFVRLLNPRWVRNHEQRFKSYVDAYDITDRVIDSATRGDPEKPFMIWAHYMDNHLPYVSGKGAQWYKETPKLLKHLGHPNHYLPSETFLNKRPDSPERWAAYSALYDAALYDVDRQISRLIDALDEKGLRENTIIAICGDHGEEFGEHGDFAHNFTFYEHNIRVPMIFHRQGMVRQDIGKLVTLLDVAPTLLGFAGIDPAPKWQGHDINDSDSKDQTHVVMETFFGGNCMFDHRPLYFGVRSDTHKYLWKEYRDPRDVLTPETPELYDLSQDPEEKRNLYSPNHPVVKECNQIIADRMQDISEISPERASRPLDLP
jgi:arylsulfatase A-like enzyme